MGGAWWTNGYGGGKCSTLVGGIFSQVPLLPPTVQKQAGKQTGISVLPIVCDCVYVCHAIDWHLHQGIPRSNFNQNNTTHPSHKNKNKVSKCQWSLEVDISREKCDM